MLSIPAAKPSHIQCSYERMKKITISTTLCVPTQDYRICLTLLLLCDARNDLNLGIAGVLLHTACLQQRQEGERHASLYTLRMSTAGVPLNMTTACTPVLKFQIPVFSSAPPFWAAGK
jgi:hypothetical protein